ncbi:proline-rich protein 36-like [Schistocerca nitens]|uniref:proline-rich protein 36-like n=1 Tax=Schistocerca nitens TaxID=7011 RepID=UPI00211837C8|nr:proline-rich protein 36-like [Schistocerca nitens]
MDGRCSIHSDAPPRFVNNCYRLRTSASVREPALDQRFQRGPEHCLHDDYRRRNQVSADGVAAPRPTSPLPFSLRALDSAAAAAYAPSATPCRLPLLPAAAPRQLSALPYPHPQLSADGVAPPRPTSAVSFPLCPLDSAAAAPSPPSATHCRLPLLAAAALANCQLCPTIFLSFLLMMLLLPNLHRLWLSTFVHLILLPLFLLLNQLRPVVFPCLLLPLLSNCQLFPCPLPQLSAAGVAAPRPTSTLPFSLRPLNSATTAPSALSATPCRLTLRAAAAPHQLSALPCPVPQLFPDGVAAPQPISALPCPLCPLDSANAPPSAPSAMPCRLPLLAAAAPRQLSVLSYPLPQLFADGVAAAQPTSALPCPLRPLDSTAVAPSAPSARHCRLPLLAAATHQQPSALPCPLPQLSADGVAAPRPTSALPCPLRPLDSAAGAPSAPLPTPCRLPLLAAAALHPLSALPFPLPQLSADGVAAPPPTSAVPCPLLALGAAEAVAFPHPMSALPCQLLLLPAAAAVPPALPISAPPCPLPLLATAVQGTLAERRTHQQCQRKALENTARREQAEEAVGGQKVAAAAVAFVIRNELMLKLKQQQDRERARQI